MSLRVAPRSSMGRLYSHQTGRLSRWSLDQSQLGPMRPYSRNPPRARRILALSRCPPICPSTGRTRGSPRLAGGFANQSPQEPGEELPLRCESAQRRSHESFRSGASESSLPDPSLDNVQTGPCGEKIAPWEEIIPHPEDWLRAGEHHLPEVVVVQRVVVRVLFVVPKRVEPLPVGQKEVEGGVAAILPSGRLDSLLRSGGDLLWFPAVEIGQEEPERDLRIDPAVLLPPRAVVQPAVVGERPRTPALRFDEGMRPLGADWRARGGPPDVANDDEPLARLPIDFRLSHLPCGLEVSRVGLGGPDAADVIAELSVVEACDSPTVPVSPLVRTPARRVPHDGEIGELLEEVVVHGAAANRSEETAHPDGEGGRRYFNVMSVRNRRAASAPRRAHGSHGSRRA